MGNETEVRKELAVAASPEAFVTQGFTHCLKDRTTGNIGALFTSSEDAYVFLWEKTVTPEGRVSRAEGIVSGEYFKDVRDTADSIRTELNERIADGEHGETLREWLIEHIHETIDSAGRVIYTAQAMECLRHSDNDGAYIDEFGTDGLVSDGALDWSKLAFSAFKLDVEERLTSEGVDLNSPVPECDDCGSEDQDQRRWKIGDDVTGWKLQCDTCHEEAEEPDDEEPDTDHDLEAKDDTPDSDD